MQSTLNQCYRIIFFKCLVSLGLENKNYGAKLSNAANAAILQDVVDVISDFVWQTTVNGETNWQPHFWHFLTKECYRRDAWTNLEECSLCSALPFRGTNCTLTTTVEGSWTHSGREWVIRRVAVGFEKIGKMTFVLQGWRKHSALITSLCNTLKVIHCLTLFHDVQNLSVDMSKVRD